jgi:Tfp pilus assembly protein PilE
MATRRNQAEAVTQAEAQLWERQTALVVNEALSGITQWQATYGERIDNLVTLVEEIRQSAKAVKEDHDKRLTKLERWKSESRGERNVLVVVAGIVGAVITWIMEHVVK